MSDLEKLIEQGWADHERDSGGVLARLADAIPSVATKAELPGFVGLLVHVAGEHLGCWRDGLGLLDRLAPLAPDGATPEAQALERSRAVLLLGLGDRAAAEAAIARAHPANLPDGSTRARVLATAASALAGQKRVDEAIARFEEALGSAGYGPEKSDPAARALAVTGNNLACALEEKTDRTPAEDRLLLLAASTGRRFWEIAGTWLEVERAEYRLAFTQLALGNARESLEHARACLALCEANSADAGELFFAHEALARSHRALGEAAEARDARRKMEEFLARLDESLKGPGRETLAKYDGS
jgi:hypothetical protein